MAESWAGLLTKWTAAGLIDEQTAGRIRAYELDQVRPTSLRWSVRIALAFGAVLLGAGALLFVSAHWDGLSPSERFALVVAFVGVFHVAGAGVTERFPGLATTLHGVGTVVLGAGIFLAGQIFNLDEHWPSGLMLWAVGAAIGWALLKDQPQMTLVAILAPAWLTSEWFVATGPSYLYWSAGTRVAACGIFLLALTYFTAARDRQVEPGIHTIVRLGAGTLLPAGLFLTSVLTPAILGAGGPTVLPTALWALGWAAALGLPLILAVTLRRTAAWPNALAIVWVLVLIRLRPIAGELSLYAWWALGATALAAWGVREARSERVNMGVAIFGITVLVFYFSQVMDKLGRSASLIGFGLLFLAGGWALERVRRRLVLPMRGGEA